jgi:nicotinate-nucleotide adenylyltransferase
VFGLTLTGLLGGSFNPAHQGHRAISLAVLRELDLDEVWWLVSPGNPLKPRKGMAPLDARLARARQVARRAPIEVTAIETHLGTRYTVDTVRALQQRFPDRRFVWIMGADIIGEFHRWRDWRRLAALVPIAVLVRPGYMGIAGASPASAWLRRFVRHLGDRKDWTRWRPPALVLVPVRPDPTSATALRRASPDWYRAYSNRPATRALLRRRLP